jgi:hypothetical protein
MTKLQKQKLDEQYEQAQRDAYREGEGEGQVNMEHFLFVEAARLIADPSLDLHAEACPLDPGYVRAAVLKLVYNLGGMMAAWNHHESEKARALEGKTDAQKSK